MTDYYDLGTKHSIILPEHCKMEGNSPSDGSVDSNLNTEIYYHRELLIYSVEGRRVELLTISSFHDILSEREERLPNLFVDENTPRCYKFKNKKVILIVINRSRLLYANSYFDTDCIHLIASTSW